VKAVVPEPTSGGSGTRVGLTFELRRPTRRGALGPRRTMKLATALRGPRAPRLAGSPLERGVRRRGYLTSSL